MSEEDKQKIEDGMKTFRVITPILLMILTGIMTFTGTVITSYLSSITSSIESISSDLKSYIKETDVKVNQIDKRVTVLEHSVKNKHNINVADTIEY